MTDAEGLTPATYRLPLHDDSVARHGPERPWETDGDLALLKSNAIWFCRLRWIVVAILALAGALACWGPDFSRWGLHLAYAWPLTAAAALAVFNSVYLAVMPSVDRQRSISVLRSFVWVQIVVDLIVLTGVVHYLGSVASAAPFMYLFHIVLACIFFPRLQSLAVALVAAWLYLVCVLVERTGLIEESSIVLNPGSEPVVEMPTTVWLAHVGFTFAVWGAIWFLASRLAAALRQRERTLAATNYRLEKSTEERVRHMLQTTHQMKAPFAAIHANSQLLSGGYCGELPEKARTVVGKIVTRCDVLSQQIVDMLQLANLRSESQASLPPTEIELCELTEISIARVEPTAERRGIRIEADLEPVTFPGIEDHLRMLIDNLMSNAVNYSFDGGVVTVSCRRVSDAAAEFRVRDRGIGISREKLPRVFGDYFRASEAVQHNNASTGLGLAIVRQVARDAGIAVEVQSAPGWGTCFLLTIPNSSPEVGTDD